MEKRHRGSVAFLMYPGSAWKLSERSSGDDVRVDSRRPGGRTSRVYASCSCAVSAGMRRVIRDEIEVRVPSFLTIVNDVTVNPLAKQHPILALMSIVVNVAQSLDRLLHLGPQVALALHILQDVLTLSPY